MEIDPNPGPLPELPAVINEEPVGESNQNSIPSPCPRPAATIPFRIAKMDSEFPKSFLQNEIDQELSSTPQNVSKKLKLNHEQRIPPGTIPKKFDELEFRPKERELKQSASSVFSIPPVIQMLEKSAPESALHKLRQLSSGFYESLSSQYWDRLNKKIRIQYNPFTDTSNICSVALDEKGEKDFTNIGGILYCDSLSHTFRALELINDWEPDQIKLLNGPATNNVIGKVSRHITHVEMEFPMVMTPVSYDDDYFTGLIVSEFLNGFSKLTNFNLNVPVEEETCQDMTYQKLLQGISGLNPNTKITVDFFARQNVEWTSFSLQLVKIADGFKSGISKPKLKMYLECNIRSLTELAVLTIFVLQHQDIIDFLQITIGWSWAVGLMSLSPNDELEIVRCLLDLSPFVSKMTITDKYPYNASRNVLNFDTEWLKLTDLTIIGYSHPLEKILQNAPKLKKLYLYVDPKQCLYMPSASALQLTQTDKSNLQRIFGNLKELKDFNFDMICKNKDQYRIWTGRELEEVLKEILGFPENFNLQRL